MAMNALMVLAEFIVVCLEVILEEVFEWKCLFAAGVGAVVCLAESHVNKSDDVVLLDKLK